MDLSVLIPARNELWLTRTVEDVLRNIRGRTEIVVVVDGGDHGGLPIDPIPADPHVTVVMLPASIGQRAATNLAARLARGRYVMKLDAHCAVSEGFDEELVATGDYLGPGVTQIPKQHNLHVFDWRCRTCGRRTYQGRERTVCGPAPWLRPQDQAAEARALGPGCGAPGPFERVVVWNALRKPTTAWRFGPDLHFEYWHDYSRRRPAGRYEVAETLSCLGACWFLDRARFLAWGGLDEAHGSWGQMGTEIACKSWLSGGRMVTNTRAWFSHLFRTQGDDFGFPYENPEADKQAAQRYSRDLWLGNRWPGQVRPLRWLVETFEPVPGWTPEDVQRLPARLSGRKARSKGIVWYSHGEGDKAVLGACSEQLRRATTLPAVSVLVGKGTTYHIPHGRHFWLEGAEPGRLTYLRQILAGLEALETDIAFLCEHDVLYHPSHFDFDCPATDKFFYNQHTWRVDAETGRALYVAINQVSGLCADRLLLVEHYRRRVAHCERTGQTNEAFDKKFGYEPANTRINRERFGGMVPETWMSPVANVDIKSASCLTPGKWRRSDWFLEAPRLRRLLGWREADRVPGWPGATLGRFTDWLGAAVAREVVRG